MKLRNLRKHSAFTLIELLVVISIIAIIAGFALPVFASAKKKGALANSLNNAKQIALALKMYAGDQSGSFPIYKDPDDPSTVIQNSNETFEALMPRYTQSKTIFKNPASAWCRGANQPATTENQYKVLPNSDCDWSYVQGLTETSDSRWPLFATAFTPGGTKYVKKSGEKGGVWDGTDAVMSKVDGSATMEVTPDQFIKRADSPKKNAFEKDSDWLAGDQIKVLSPQ